MVPRARFVYRNGVAAAWVEDRASRTAERVLYATGVTYEKQANGRVPNLLRFADSDDTWEIRQQAGGCGCGSRIKAVPIEQLLDPDFNHIE